MEPLESILPKEGTLLMGPGPCNPFPSVLQAQALPLLGHLDPRFTDQVMSKTSDGLKTLFLGKDGKDSKSIAFAASGTGSSGMECLAANLFEPGETVVVGVNGVFGGRISECLGKLGVNVVKIQKDFGTGFSAEEVRAAIDGAGKDVAGVWLVRAETSTGYLQPEIEAIAAEAHKGGDRLFLLDCVTALVGSELRLEDWGVDAAFSGTQKCLGVPPSLAPVWLGERALARFNARKSPVPTWYLDLGKLLAYYQGAETAGATKRVYHHTAPISSCFALYEGVRMVLTPSQEGEDVAATVAAVQERYKELGARLSKALLDRGFTYAVSDESCRLPQLHCVFPPTGVSEAKLRQTLMAEEGIEVGAGLGAFAGKAVRIGMMGANADEAVIDRVIAALDKHMPSAKL